MRSDFGVCPEEPDPVAGYRVLRRVGQGGSGVVYLAEQLQPARLVALKVLSLPVDERSLQRFDREYEISMRLGGHPHIIAVFGHGTTRAGRPYLAMQYFLDGSLADRLTQRGPLPVDEAVRIGIQIAEALDQVHQVGAVHRDVKPGNILTSTDGPVLSDFGIAVLGDDLDATIRTHAFTPGYTAPEVLESPSRAGPASDTYSLAATLYHLLAGRPPFDLGPDEGISRLLRRIETEQPPEIARADLPLRLISILYRALAKQPDDRFATTAEFACSLQQFWTDHLTEQQNTTESLTSVADRVAAHTAPALPAPELATIPPAPVPPTGVQRPRGSRVRHLVAAVVGMVLLAVGAAIAFRPASPANAWRPAPSGRQATVPALSGLSRDNAVERLTQAGLTVGTTAYEPETAVVAGEVIASSPTAGQTVRAGTAVNLVISAGPGNTAGSAPPSRRRPRRARSPLPRVLRRPSPTAPRPATSSASRYATSHRTPATRSAAKRTPRRRRTRSSASPRTPTRPATTAPATPCAGSGARAGRCGQRHPRYVNLRRRNDAPRRMPIAPGPPTLDRTSERPAAEAARLWWSERMTSTPTKRLPLADLVRDDRPRVETVAYAIGGLLMLSGVFHLVVFLIDGGPWEGPVSWRKPTTFGLSFGLTLITIAWVSSSLILRPRTRAWLLGIFAADCVLEVAGITIQAWRHVPSHFNTETPVDQTIAMSLAFGGAVLVAVLGTLAVVALRGRARGGRDLVLALRAGFFLLLVALGTGVAMIAKGTVLVREGHPQLAYDTAGSLKPLHGTTLHAVLVLPLVAELTRVLGWPERRRYRAVLVASGLYLVATAVALWLSLRPLGGLG